MHWEFDLVWKFTMGVFLQSKNSELERNTLSMENDTSTSDPGAIVKNTKHRWIWATANK